MSGFDDAVLAWLKQKHPEAVEVVSVRGDGSDWAGDTEGGFYSRFSTDIRYLTTAGDTVYTEVSGDDMESLWEHVVRSWPSA